MLSPRMKKYKEFHVRFADCAIAYYANNPCKFLPTKEKGSLLDQFLNAWYPSLTRRNSDSLFNGIRGSLENDVIYSSF